MDLSEISRKLNSFAPTSLAGSWDNVGMLMEPTPPHSVSTLLLTNDLTEDVMKEALDVKANMILSYHPPIFSPLKRLSQRTWKERIVVTCLENRIAVYSPHTCLDAVAGGVNDWLLQPFDGPRQVIEQVHSPAFPTCGGFQLNVSLPSLPTASKRLEAEILATPGVTLLNKNSFERGEEQVSRISINCTQKALPKVIALTQNVEDVKDTVEVLSLQKPPLPGHGPGRLARLSRPVSLSEAVARTKQHLGLDHLRVARAVGVEEGALIKKVAVCAGSGASVLRGVDAGLYLTGEMSHHEVLDATHRGVHVLLAEHSNTERGYLRELRDKLHELLEGRVQVLVSHRDADPLQVV